VSECPPGTKVGRAERSRRTPKRGVTLAPKSVSLLTGANGEQMRPTDRELVERARKGDREALGDLVERYRDMIYGLGYHLTRNFESARDLAQEAFVQAYLKLGQLREPARFSGWLRQITTNVHHNLSRRREVTTVALEEAREVPDTKQPSGIEVVVREALMKLREPERLALTLHYINGYSQSEIGEFLGVRPETVKTRLASARQHLKTEVMAMVEDTFEKKKLPDEFTEETVAEAMRRGDEAMRNHLRGEALRNYEEALAALDKLEPTAEHRQLKIELLRRKGNALAHAPGGPEPVRFHEEALALAEQLGDRGRQAQMLLSLAGTYANTGQEQKATEACERAHQLYRELEDAHGEAECLSWMGTQRLFAKDPEAAQKYFAEALRVAEPLKIDFLIFVSRAVLALLTELGMDGFPRALGWGGGCAVLDRIDGVTRYQGEREFMKTGDAPPPFRHSGPLHQVSHLRTFLDPSVVVGGSWSGDCGSYWHRQLRATVTVKSDSEHVTVPVGEFRNCLLTQQVTTESDQSQDVPETARALDRRFLCGTRHAWYAPGVGLVQLHVQSAEGSEALMQLSQFSLATERSGYLPLAVGNTWDYIWANLPPEYAAKDLYRVAANRGHDWFLEHYAYCTNRE